MFPYLLLSGAVLLMTASFACQKLWQKNVGTAPARGLLFFVISGISAFLLFFIIGGFQFHLTPFSLLTSGLLTAACVVYTILGFRILAGGGLGLYTLCIMSGGMVLPYLYGLIFLDEPFSVWRLVGLFIILCGVVYANIEPGKSGLDKKTVLLCAAVFVLNGLVSVFSKMHAVETVRAVVSTEEYVAMSNLYKLVFGAVALPFFMKRHDPEAPENHDDAKADTAPKDPKFAFRFVPIAVAAALTDALGYSLQLRAAGLIDASIQYPFLTGGSIVLSMLCGVICFGEKASKRSIIGTALCFIGTFFFLNV